MRSNISAEPLHENHQIGQKNPGLNSGQRDAQENVPNDGSNVAAKSPPLYP